MRYEKAPENNVVYKRTWIDYFKFRKFRKANRQAWVYVYRTHYHMNPLKARLTARKQDMPVFDI